MAIRLGDIFVAIRADNDKLKGDLDAAKGQATGWASGLAGTLKGALGGALLGGVATLTGAVAGIGVAAFSAASDFDAATKKMQSQMGTSDEIAKGYGDTLKNIFANNFGDSIDDVADSITKVNQAFERIGGVESNQELQQATEAAIALRDTFDAEVNETTSAAVTLMQNFGISATEAFDLVAYGFQNGLDGSGDFLDSIGEYSTQFSNGGATAEQFFSVLQTGLQGGMLGTDKAADAFKEFGIRIQDGSSLTADGLKRLGLNSGEIMKGLSDGSLEVVDVFQQVIGALNNTDDPLVRAQAGVALLGTQYEDLGDSAVLALDASGISLQKVAGSINSLNAQYNTIPAFFEGLRRRALVAIEPIGGALLSVFNAVLPSIEEVFGKIEAVIASATEKALGMFETINAGGGGQVAAVVGGIGAASGAATSFDAAAKVTKVDWGDFSYTYDALSNITKVDWDGWLVGGASTWTYDANAQVLSVDWTTKSGEGVAFVYDAEAGIKKIDWNAGENGAQFKYDAEAGITAVDFGIFSYVYNAQAKIGERSILWGLFTHQYDVGAGVGTVDFGLFSYVYDTKAKISSFEFNDAALGKRLSDLSANLGEGLEKAADSLGKNLGAPDWVQDLINWKPSQGAPDWVDSLLNWQPFGGSANLEIAGPTWSEFITKLVWGEVVPNLSWADWLAKILWSDYVPGMTWSDFLDSLSWGDYIASFSWSDFVPKLAWPASITGFSWSSFITGINLSALVPTFPGWTSLFNQLNPFGSAPADVNPGATSSGSIGGSGRSLLDRSGPLVQMGDVIVKDRQDAEALAYGIARRLAYR